MPVELHAHMHTFYPQSSTKLCFLRVRLLLKYESNYIHNSQKIIKLIFGFGINEVKII